ncbi:hypothetical protein GCM10007385_18400 [Tateyamaria omphalii]|uniref:hypothetical protein n=1 Tax=Tateyamaria omphalii TaxID=299262 RepID=UPI0016733EF0|nr:hypothetical protein [Tateyamaria omphalii]GGX50289.1 hypothetical protein GCM10007385_18400 [Tateyamaria omphalii]
MIEFFKEKIEPVLTPIASLLTVVSIVVAGAFWISNLQTRVNTLEELVRDARLNSVAEEKTIAIADINQRAGEVFDAFTSKEVEIRGLTAKIDTNYSSTLERINAAENQLREEQEANLNTFQVQLRNEISLSEARFNTLIVQKSQEFLSEIEAITEIKSQVETTASKAEQTVSGIETQQKELAERVQDFEALIRTYQKFSEDRIDEAAHPDRSILFLASDERCPTHFSEYARTLFYVYEDDLPRVDSDKSFLAESTFDFGIRSVNGQKSIGFVNPRASGQTRSYDAYQIKTCIKTG